MDLLYCTIGGVATKKMIRIESEIDDVIVRVIVRANQSMSWYENVILVLSIGLVSVGSATVLALMGFWMALPFAGLEFLLLVLCFYKTLRRLGLQEVITIEQEVITIERGIRSPQISIATPRHWSRLSYRKSTNPFEVGALSLLVHNKSYRLGQALGKEEKQQLFLVLQAYFSPEHVLLIEAGQQKGA